MATDDVLKARVLAAVAAAPSPTRIEGRRLATILLTLSVIVALALFQGIGGLEHSEGRPLKVTLAISVGWGFFCAVLSWFVLARGRSTLGRGPRAVMIAALVTPLVLIVWTHVFYGTYEEPFARVGWRCLAYNLLMATPPLGALVVLRRGVEPRAPWALGAAIGAVCGGWAGLLVDLWCPLTNLPHILFGHVLPLGLLIAAGTFLGRQMLGPRATRSANAEPQSKQR